MVNGNPRPETNEADRSAGDQVLVPFREGGEKPPLYFIPAGFGDLRTFRRVVELLDDDRPVYGLQPPKVELNVGVRNKPVQWLVSKYIAQIRRVQPAGPYHLAGNSSGGLLAAEIARQLIRQGDDPGLLVLLDPPLRNPQWVNLPFLTLNKLCNLTRLTDTIRWMLIRRSNSMLMRAASDEGLCTHVSILGQHEAAPYPGRIVFFRPRRSWIRWVNRTRIGRSWRRIARDGLEVHRIPGAHNEVLRGRQREFVAAILRACLQRIEFPGPTPRLQYPTSRKVAQHARTVYSVSIQRDRIDEEFDWDTMERLHRKGLTSDPVGIARSEAFIEGGVRAMAAALHRPFDTDG